MNAELRMGIVGCLSRYFRLVSSSIPDRSAAYRQGCIENTWRKLDMTTKITSHLNYSIINYFCFG